MSSTLKETILSFADLAASTYLSESNQKLVTTLLPPIADLILNSIDVNRILAQESYSTLVTTQGGQSYEITVTPKENPEFFQALRSARERHSDSSAPATRTQQFMGFRSVGSEDALAGGVSILNGIIGVQW